MKVIVVIFWMLVGCLLCPSYGQIQIGNNEFQSKFQQLKQSSYQKGLVFESLIVEITVLEIVKNNNTYIDIAERASEQKRINNNQNIFLFNPTIGDKVFANNSMMRSKNFVLPTSHAPFTGIQNVSLPRNTLKRQSTPKAFGGQLNF